jgi:uncharacterized repeat protein (TIGR01451 family)
MGLALAVLLSGPANTSLKVLTFAASAPNTLGPDLGVTMFRSGDDSRPLMAAGQTVTISVGVSNLRGDSDAHSTVLTMLLPTGLKLQQARPAPDRTEPANGGQSLVWNLGTVKAGGFPRMFELDLTAAANVQAGTELPVSATVATSDADANQKNNSATLPLVVQPAVADLAVQSDLDSLPMTVGHPLKFTAQVRNWGNIVASASALALTLPAKVTFKSSDPAPTATSSNTVTWQLGDIAPAGSSTVAVMIALDTSLAATAADTTTENLLKFKLDASTIATQLNPANNHLEIDRHIERAGSDLKVWLSVQGADNPGELPVGKDVTYTITYGNFGNAPAQHASVSLSLSQGLSLLRAAPPQAGTSKNDRFAGGVLSWNLGDLAVGQSNVIKSQIHVASVPEDGSLVMATISAPGPSANSGENVAYSLRHAPRAAGLHGAAAQGGHLFRWLFLLAVVIVLWAIFRARRRPAAT